MSEYKKEKVKIEITISKCLNDWLDDTLNYIGKSKDMIIEESLDTYRRRINFLLATNQIIREVKNKFQI